MTRAARSAFVLAAPSSGSGKTTAAALLCLALRARGLSVQPFKLGPDYLDPTHLSRAAGRPTRNIDSFLLPPERVSTLFARAASTADVSVVEGVMGLYDGRSPTSDEHSSADLARQLGLKVVLLIDAGGMARTAAALAAGLRDFGKGVDVAGVILNRVGSEGHARLCEAALAEVGLPLLGFVLSDPALHLPERHLGLHAAEEAVWDEAAALHAARFLRLDALRAATRLPALDAAPPLHFPGPRARIAYAWDEAFSFYYPDALDELRLAGAELVPFSPLRDAALPAGVGGLLLGGGYPELYAAPLSANASMRRAIRDFAASGRPVVGECGGLMYLGQSLLDLEGVGHAMCGVIPARTRMQPRLSLGYREAEALAASPLAPVGAALRGHEFHYSERLDPPTDPAYRWTGHAGVAVEEGHAQGNVLASYLHLHYGGSPEMAKRLVAACQR
ncbi:cobyrinic acid a,c-diamide synthase [Deinococcus piscis]|uniref:Cobyrinate a,c-diamide synthase n=1 Tax=Deinococcus piscis TaxID=394230 RepID=A0ABQ3K8T0_9DEIO|nr:cobyrinate a,c-diamide synthase [Deinococcus piscis]GHG02959.1 cobyrinic acid a,c-diamide synthase [Deinococcus piscis]